MSTALQMTAYNLPSVQDGLQAYLQRVQQIPLLSAEEERDLAVAYHQQGDLQAAQKLILSNLRFVASIARTYSGYGLALADLIQEGTIGLMKAVKRFDPFLGVRLVAFAVHWIKSEIHEFVIRNWRIVKIATTKSQRKLFFKLRGKKSRLAWFTQEEVAVVAKDLGVLPQEVIEMESRLHGKDMTFDMPVNEDSGDTYVVTPEQYLEANEGDPLQALAHSNEQESQEGKLKSALESLDPRSLDIVTERYLNEEKLSLKDLAAKYKVSLERIRQIEKAAILALKKMITAH